ncbi:hypothetical protein BJY21_002167 [Kineosphaera limosa]|nr:hypothetical protein [Kineosphaera limosa]NYE00983.1 hypothetical protein [Kineosphaera limosa]
MAQEADDAVRRAGAFAHLEAYLRSTRSIPSRSRPRDSLPLPAHATKICTQQPFPRRS